MTYCITRNTTAAEKPPTPPINPATGEAFPMMAQYGGGWLQCWCEDPEEAVSALIGDPTYLDEVTDEQARLVARIRAAMRIATVLQAEQIHESQCDGRWDRCTADEQAMLFAPRFTQPAGLYEDLFGEPWWVADVALVVVSTGYVDGEKPLPLGDPGRVWVIDPRTPEELLSSLANCGAVRLFQRVVDV